MSTTPDQAAVDTYTAPSFHGTPFEDLPPNVQRHVERKVAQQAADEG